MSAVTTRRSGVVAELDGKYWGVEYEDGQGSAMAFGPIERARIADPRYCKSATDMTYPSSPDFKALEPAKLVPVSVTTIYETREKP